MGYALYKLSKEDATIFVKLTEKCWNGKERDLTKLNKYERAVLLKLMDKAGEYTPGEKPVKKYNDNHDPKTGRFAPKPGGKYSAGDMDKLKGMIENKARFSALSQSKAMGMSQDEFNTLWAEINPPKQVEQKPKKERPAGLANIPAKREENKPASADGAKEKQFAMIQNSNPMRDDYHTGIRSVSDILTAKEAFADFGGTPDWTQKDAQKALKTGKVTIYSSYQIDTGVFVTPSKRIAQDYAGNGKVHSKRVPIDDVAWISDTEGQFAPVSGVAKSFSESIRKYNKWHDPKTGRFTSAPGGSDSKMNATVGEIEAAGYSREMAEILADSGMDMEYLMNRDKIKGAQAKVKEVLPDAKVQLLSADADLAVETAESIKTVLERYPKCKDAFAGFVVSDDGDRSFEKEPKAMAFFNPDTKRIHMNPDYFGDRDYLADVYAKTVELKFHPQGTNHNSLIMHEMAHAMDTYVSEKKGRSISLDIKKSVHAMFSKSGKPLTEAGIVDGLCDYATVNHREFFASAMAEYLNSPNPRPIAKTVGQMFDRMVSLL